MLFTNIVCWRFLKFWICSENLVEVHFLEGKCDQGTGVTQG